MGNLSASLILIIYCYFLFFSKNLEGTNIQHCSFIFFFVAFGLHLFKIYTYKKKMEKVLEYYSLSEQYEEVNFNKYGQLYEDWYQYLAWLRKDSECVGFDYITRLAIRLYLALGIANAIRICFYIIWLSYIVHLLISVVNSSPDLLASVYSITWVASLYYLLMILHDEMRIYALWEYDSLLNTRHELNKKLRYEKFSLRL